MAPLESGMEIQTVWFCLWLGSDSLRWRALASWIFLEVSFFIFITVVAIGRS